MLCTAYVYAGQPERTAEWCRSRVQSGRDTHTVSRIGLIISLAVAQSYEEAIAATTGLIEAAEATRNPWALSFALLALRDRPHACRSGRCSQGQSPRAAGCRKTAATAATGHTWRPSLPDSRPNTVTRSRALHYIAVAIHNHHDSGNPTSMRPAMATLSTVLDRMGRYEPAATIAGFASTPFAVAAYPEFLTTQPTCALSSVNKTTNRSHARARR